MPDPVAVIDIGSNTIKLLVAGRSATGAVDTVHFAVEEARIGQGIAALRPTLAEESIERGTAAVARLLAAAAPFSPRRISLVATSAVRDAVNGADFAARILHKTGHPVRILSGTEEADAIGRGIAADPALAGVDNFYLFDLGGGSLEALEFRDGRAMQAVSLPLGCVRLTERCVADPAAPLGDSDLAAITAITDQTFASFFRFSLPPPATAVATGGTVTTVRAMLGIAAGQSLATTNPVVTTSELRRLLECAAALPLAQRRELPGLPPARADVFPAALATILAVARLGGVERLTHSFYNLRYGIAADLLAG